jgi:hypothetical protein
MRSKKIWLFSRNLSTTTQTALETNELGLTPLSRVDGEGDGVSVHSAARGSGDHSDPTGNKGRAALWGIELKDHHRSGLGDVRSLDNGDQLVTADEGRQAKGSVPTHHGIAAEAIAVEGQKELAASGCCAAGRDRSNGRHRRTGSAGYDRSQRDR